MHLLSPSDWVHKCGRLISVYADTIHHVLREPFDLMESSLCSKMGKNGLVASVLVLYAMGTVRTML